MPVLSLGPDSQNHCKGCDIVNRFLKLKNEEMCCLETVHIYVGNPVGHPKYIFTAFGPHISLFFVLKISFRWRNPFNDFENLGPG